MINWEPIETAPKDREILLYSSVPDGRDNHFLLGIWFDGDWTDATTGCFGDPLTHGFIPTYWSELNEPTGALAIGDSSVFRGTNMDVVHYATEEQRRMGSDFFATLGDSFTADGEHEYRVQHENNKAVRWYIDDRSVSEEEFNRAFSRS